LQANFTGGSPPSEPVWGNYLIFIGIGLMYAAIHKNKKKGSGKI
jgi:hypothetical protein